MFQTSKSATLTAIALGLSATAAQADLTAAEVWADWKAYMASTGYEITANEATSGGTLTVTDMVMSMDLSEEDEQVIVDLVLDEVTFTENGDGTVAIGLPETSGFDVAMTSPEGENVKVRIDYSQTAPAMVATGDPSELTYTYSADAITMKLGELNIDGVVLTEEIARFVVTMGDLDYTTKTGVGDLRSIAQNMAAGSLTYDVLFQDPQGDGTFKLNGGMQQVNFAGAGALPLEADTTDMNAMLDGGFAFDGNFTSAGGSYDLSFNGPDGSGTINSTSEGANLRVAMGPDGLGYDVTQTGLSMNMLITEFPLPISFSAATTALNLQMPVQKSEEEQDFALGLTLQDFAMSDMIWGLFDPTSQLPRDPATMVVDLSGKAKLLFDFLDPAQAAVLEQADAAPGELNALTLNALELDAVGAKLTGSGDFTFDNGDTQTFDGIPRPLGALDLSLVGGNGLLDKLVGMGLLPQEQAMGARMMMGLFAVPGDGEDSLKSRIEVNEAGHILANGQRLR